MKLTQQEKNSIKFLEEFKQKELLKTFDLDAEFEDDVEAVPDIPEGLVSPFDIFVKDGEIRLLSNTDKLTYCAILPWDWEQCLLIPFSHCDNPATDQEMYATGAERGLYRQVLQIWNARTVHRTVLAKSWIAGKLSETEKSQINKLLRKDWLGSEISDDIKNLTGAPLLDMTDIRRIYMRQEQHNFEQLSLENEQARRHKEELEQNSNVLVFEKLRPFVENQLMAAAGKNCLSEVYLQKNGELNYLTGATSTDFDYVAAGEPIPHFYWYIEDLTEEYRDGMQVLFRHKSSGQILGSGVLQRSQSAPAVVDVILANTITVEETPEISSPSEIQLIICVE